mmetsp:Transcript_34121/g.74611  ORF Transcript_34121/g.74611 Transcript_34121/m.74611 type:complete len:217 (-) Transcript_34121:1042-1692(-)
MVVLLRRRVVLQDLLVDELAHVLLAQLGVLEAKVQLANGLARRLVRGQAVRVEDGILEGLFRRDAVAGVEHEHLLEQGDEGRVDGAEDGGEGDRRLERHAGQEAASLLVPHLLQFLLAGRSDDICDQLELVRNVTTGEQWSSQDDLCDNATEAPDVHSGGILGEEGSAQLRCSIPSRRNIIRPKHSAWLIIKRRSRQAEVAYLQLAVRVRKDILRF